MAPSNISRPFAYNNTGLPISGTTSYDTLVVGDIETDYSSDYGGIKWWGGPEESELLGYVIGNVRPSGQPVPPGVVGTGTVGFWRSKFHTDESFLNLANYIGAKNGQPPFATTTDAENWLQSNGYYTSFNLPTPTPTPTAQSTPTPTPTVTNTQTPTVTQTETPTNTPSVTPTQTETVTPSVTPTLTQTPTNTNTPSPSVTATQTQTQTVTPTNTSTPTTTPTNTPSVTPTNAIPIRVLILGDGSASTVGNFLSSYLSATGHPITYSAVTIGTSYTGDGNITTSNYDVVLFYTNGGDTGTSTLSNALTSYVNTGGNIVSGVFLWNVHVSGYNFTGTTAFNVTDVQSNEPTGNFTVNTPSIITNGIGSSIGGGLTNGTPTLVAGSTLYASYDSNSAPLVAVNQVGSSTLVSLNTRPAGINSSTSAQCKLIGNAIIFASGVLNPTPTPTATATVTPSITASQTVTPTNTITTTPTVTPTNPALLQMLNETTGSRTITSFQLDGNTQALTSGSYPITAGNNGYALTHGANSGSNGVVFNFGGSGTFDLYSYLNGTLVNYLSSYNSNAYTMGGLFLQTSDQLLLRITNPNALPTPTTTSTPTQTPTRTLTPTPSVTTTQTPTNTTSQTPTPTPTATGLLTPLSYLVVGGGAGGGANWGGGGGAGQVVTGTTNLSKGVTYTISLGNGGNGATGGSGQGSNGGTTVFSGTGLSVSAVGGGGGGYNQTASSATNGSAGASGGGGGGGGAARSTGGSATAGFSGGSVTINNSGSGGGGGSTQAGANGTSPGGLGTGGNGGNGTTSNITGSAVVYAGGGGGGGDQGSIASTGGTGGGGNGGNTTSGAGANATGYGSGGGGGATVGGNGGNGSRGVVIISVPANQLGTYTGNPIVGLNGSNTILTFTGNGTYTASSVAPPVSTNNVLYYDPSNASSYLGTGTVINDLSGNGLNGSMSGITFTTPYFAYNGSTSQVRISDNSLLEPGTGDWTMEVWVRQTNSTGSQVVLGKFDQGGLSADVSYSIRTVTGGSVRGEWGNGASSVNTANFSLSLNTWYQLVYVFNNVANNNIITYVNGAQQSTTTHTFSSILNSTNPLYLGSYNGGEFAQWFVGNIGITRLYSSALSASEVLQNFNANKGLYGL